MTGSTGSIYRNTPLHSSLVRTEPPSDFNMAPAISYVLPAMQLVCHLIVPETPAFNVTTTESYPVTEAPLQTQSVALPAGYVAYPDIGVAYKVSTEQVKWKLARERCIEEGAHLAVIDSFTKFEYLMNQTTSVSSLHVGIYRMYDDTEWVSASTGSTIETIPWAAGEPFGDYDCVATSKSPRGLINYSCNDSRYYVCELLIPENYDVQENQVVTIPAN